jgi:hypothetical protein
MMRHGLRQSLARFNSSSVSSRTERDRASVPVKTPVNLGFWMRFAMRRTRYDKSWSTLKEGLRIISFAQVLRSNDVSYLGR